MFCLLTALYLFHTDLYLEDMSAQNSVMSKGCTLCFGSLCFLQQIRLQVCIDRCCGGEPKAIQSIHWHGYVSGLLESKYDKFL